MYFEYVVVTDLETIKNVDLKYAKPLNHLMLRWSNTCMNIKFFEACRLDYYLSLVRK